MHEHERKDDPVLKAVDHKSGDLGSFPFSASDVCDLRHIPEPLGASVSFSVEQRHY